MSDTTNAKRKQYVVSRSNAAVVAATAYLIGSGKRADVTQVYQSNTPGKFLVLTQGSGSVAVTFDKDGKLTDVTAV